MRLRRGMSREEIVKKLRFPRNSRPRNYDRIDVF